MKIAIAAASLSLIGVASLLAPSPSHAQDVPPSVHVPQSQSVQPSNIGSSAARRTSAQFIAQPAGSASGAAAAATVAQRSAPTAKKQQPASGAANSR
jgi:hypothetical protein